MDKVRLGRALGYGTRHLAKTLAAVAEAAAAPPSGNPQGPESPDEFSRSHRHPRAAPPEPVFERPAPNANSNARSARPPAGSPSPSDPPRSTTARANSRTQHLRRSFLKPLAVYSTALWLRVTGSFFALLAFTMGGGAWRLRAAFHAHANTEAATHFWIFCLFTCLFGYFAVSSFVRASLAERRSTLA